MMYKDSIPNTLSKSILNILGLQFKVNFEVLKQNRKYVMISSYRYDSRIIICVRLTMHRRMLLIFKFYLVITLAI